MDIESESIPKEVATVTQWNKAKGHGVATIDELEFLVSKSALRNYHNTPEVGDKIIVYKYRKTMKGGRIEDGELATFVSSYTTTSVQTTKEVHYSVGCSGCAMAIVIASAFAVLGMIFIAR